MSKEWTIKGVREHQQAPGPNRPTGKVLAFLMDELIGGQEVAQIIINGQTGMMFVITYGHPEGEQLHEFDLRATSDVLK